MRLRGIRSLLVETDILVASIDRGDPCHEEARRVLRGFRVILSPYALMELDLLIKSGVIVVKDYQGFWKKVGNLLERYRINVVVSRPLHYAKAGELRDRYGITYFDSLHASTALIEDLRIVSYDRKTYENISQLKYVYPRNLV